MALGPQNVFLIRQGALRQHAMLSAITCFMCDIALITASVIGLQDVLESHLNLRLWMIWFGAAFLMYYGIRSIKQGLSKQRHEILQSSYPTNRWQIIMLALGFSLLNPHAIIDSLVLIGGGSGQFPGQQHVFLFGVLSSSLLWFSLLTLTAYYFSNSLARTNVWRRIELGSGVLMIVLSMKLIFNH